ncbi:hypothetical protein [Streptomyces sp. N35]|uniref:hypothetical protein n=1 Tax=Streptomyces sp. N35 TaxID=2795730 RepID=UPI0018F2B5E7|nr:hypothetical protein [Streptomyces sp. N35]
MLRAAAEDGLAFPGSPARRAFQGVEAVPCDADWSVPGRFTPYENRSTIQVENADGRAGHLPLERSREWGRNLDGRLSV